MTSHEKVGDKPTPLPLSLGVVRLGISDKVENTEKFASAFLTIVPEVPII